MCTMITTQVTIQGSAKKIDGWFDVQQVHVSYDHPFHAPFEHALNLDFVNSTLGLDARVAVELDAASARALIQSIQAVLDEAQAGGHLD